MKPYKCPKCEGKGQLLYDPANPFGGVTSSTGPWRCPACNATGIVYTVATEENWQRPSAEGPTFLVENSPWK